ncbi:MAG: hypothetical protein Q9185_006877 [Variospora sp. 1 TL-2023]
MAEEMTLHGDDTFSIVHDEEAEHEWSRSLRIPLTYLQSTTYAFYPDETHSVIKRTFTPLHAPHTRRDADWVHVNLGSLRSESVERLVDEGVFTASADDERTTSAVAENVSKGTFVPEVRHRQGAQWKEEMIDGSQLGRIKRRRGGQRSADGKSRVEWEVVEFTEESTDAGGSTGKRKLDEIGHDRNVEMRD